VGTPLAVQYSDYSNTNGAYNSGNNYGLSGYWKPEKSGLIPSVSWGFGGGSYNTSVTGPTTGYTGVKGITIASWYTGLQWDDAFIKGNALGMGVGQAPFVTQRGSMAAGTPGQTTYAAGQGGGTGSYDSNYSWEWWYKFQVTDNISITPALYYISNFSGQLGQFNGSNGGTAAVSNNLFGGLIKTTFKF